ncbi:subtilisin-like protein [Ascodesmis nigricans]|uniref:Subtilisin-like protein n=1 Tax=Ascodesmis nigricans TaxID=341454 RepID=A0A4S2MWH4_9PEZI|nr:subtilisin-like protein [Ascodesmis nigricans]
MTIFQNSAFSGFAGPMNNHCIRAMSSFDGLEHFEPAVEIFANDIQVNAPWGLQRLSQGDGLDSPPRDPSLLANNDFRYTFNGRVGNLGKDVDIYIIDTGINVDHVDFDGRARWGFTVDTETDEQGHGTHVAGTAAGSVWGVAKSANIIAVKVLGTRGTSEDILRGLDYVIKEHEKRSKESNFAGSIGSMSLGSSSRSPIIDRAVAAANNIGIHFSVAAGNESQDACRSSPAAASSFSSVVSVGAINVNDARASFSNFGQCAQVYAPGEGITSTWIGGTKKVNTIDGTSMACPHVTGLMAYMLSQDSSLKTDPAALKEKVLKSAIEIQTDVGRVKVANNGFN